MNIFEHSRALFYECGGTVGAFRRRYEELQTHLE